MYEPFITALFPFSVVVETTRRRNSTSAQPRSIRGKGFTMAYDATCIPIDEARAETPLSAIGQHSEEIDVGRAYGSGGAKLGGFIAGIESRTFTTPIK